MAEVQNFNLEDDVFDEDEDAKVFVHLNNYYPTVSIYSGMPKLKRLESGECRNPNKWWFGFQHFWISALLDFSTLDFKRSGLMKHAKSVRNPNSFSSGF